jgi:hypothetical protein
MFSAGGWRRRLGVLAAAVALSSVVGCLTLAPSATAAEPIHCGGTRITPSAGLRIDGILNVPGTFTGVLHVRAVGKTAKPGGKKSKPHDVKPPFFIRGGDLVATGSTERRISADDIKIANVTESLKKGQSREVEVTVEGARFVGEYTGAIKAGNGHCRIPLTVVVAGAADLSLVGTGSKTLVVQVVSCGNSSCGPNDDFENLTRASARRDEFEPQVGNESQSPAEITAVQVALNRNPGGQLPPRGAVRSRKQAFTRPPLRVSRLAPIAVNRDEIEPGHYTGGVYLTLRGAEKRVALPLELDVKSGPFWAIVVLLLALFVQFLAWLAGRNKPRGEELRALRDAAAIAHAKLHPEDWALLEKRFEAARDLARRGKLTEAKAARTALEKQSKWLQEVRIWIAEIEKSHDGQLSERDRARLLEFRRAIESGEEPVAKAARAELRKASGKAKHDAEQAEALREKIRREEKAQPEERKDEPEAAPRAPAGPVPIARFARWAGAHLRALIGVVRHPRTAISLLSIYGLPWLLRVLLVFAFVLAGLKELYFDNTTFGADPVLSYSALFIWGLTATAVNAGLGKVIPGAGA